MKIFYLHDFVLHQFLISCSITRSTSLVSECLLLWHIFILKTFPLIILLIKRFNSCFPKQNSSFPVCYKQVKLFKYLLRDPAFKQFISNSFLKHTLKAELCFLQITKKELKDPLACYEI